jgi:hypothetical protein
LTVNFDPSLLLSALNARSGISAASSTKVSTGGSLKTAPSAPWQVQARIDAAAQAKAAAHAATASAKKVAMSKVAAASQPTSSSISALVNSLLAGGKLINPAKANLDVHLASAAANSDYQNLFALYSGLKSLQDINTVAQSSAVTDTERLRLQRAFAAGMAQIQAFSTAHDFNQFTLTAGLAATTDMAKATQPGETDSYQTQVLGSGGLSAVLSRLQGAVSFDLNIAGVAGKTSNIHFDLAEMGSQPRTLSNVTAYLNGKLKAAGVTTRFATSDVPGAVTKSASGVASTAPDQLSLVIKGVSSEHLSFSAPSATPAVFLTQVAGQTKAASGSAAATTAATQFLKLNADPGQAATANAQLFKTDLSVAAARSVVTGPNGDVYVLSDVTSATGDGQILKGSRDTVLTRYDSAGNVVFARTLGASGSASGYALTVSPDGSQVAVASTVTGPLDATRPGSAATGSNTTVSVFDTSLGHEIWTGQTASFSGNDYPTGVAFKADGGVFVTGQTILDAGVSAQNFLVSFSKTGAQQAVATYGATAGNHAAGVVVDGNSAIVAGVENGHAVLRRFDASGSHLTQTAMRDLGDLKGGDVAGIALTSTGALVVGGSTRSGVLGLAQTLNPADGGRDLFVAQLGAGLSASATDTVSYDALSGPASSTSMTVVDGVAYLTGATTEAAGSGQTGLLHKGFAAGISLASGRTVWSRSLAGQDGQDAPTGIAVLAKGASVLDKLGLPTGAVNWAKSDRIVDFSSVRPGDSFVVVSHGGRVTLTIDGSETLATLAAKITRASGLAATATSQYSLTGRQLIIKPANKTSEITLEAGPPNANALEGLGLPAGIISGAAGDLTATVSSKSNVKIAPYALGLPADLSVLTASDRTAAGSALSSALSKVQRIYQDLTTPRTQASASASSRSSRPVPTYITHQLANYQAGLARLSSGTASSSADVAASLLG